ncbi:MATE family efflux transporter [Caloranaerobacter azorensis]|uniref:Probable multidrug resistance protein NorM n=1 Tax=Caloranaerobacter azorensis TaxID=116090 RepID=A0A6P1YAR9_9FIRM|nr:MATE family efflux transporter [Caloranaerobacter azorensis]QIB26379.1 MATE family efflux transporter [Caloranaerobacter azorensis]
MGTSKNTNEVLTNKNLTKQTIKLALPAIMEMLMQTLLGFADMAMVGSLGASAIAAVGISDMPMTTAMAVFSAISVGATALVARFIGAKDIKKANDVAKQALIISLITAVIFALLGQLLAKTIVILMGAEKDVIPQATNYFKIVSLSLPFVIIGIIMSGVFRGAGDTKTPMYVNGISNIINIVGNFFLIYHTRIVNVNIPILNKNVFIKIPGAGLEVTGAAISTAFARSIAGLFIFLIMIKGKGKIKINIKENNKIDFQIIKRIFNIGIPAAIEQFFMRFGQLLFFRIVTSLGTTMVAAHRITLTAESISFMPGFGFALAATTLVGQYLGAGDPKLAQKSGYISVKMASIVMGIFGLFFFVWPDIFLMIFTRDKKILDNARLCLRIVAISQPFLAGVMGFAGGLRGAGDTRWVLIITFIGIWGIRLTLAYLFVKVLKIGLIGAWIAMSIDLIIRGLLLFFRFKSGRWKSIQV